MAAAGDAALASLYTYRAIPAAIADYDGRMPLHIACACGHPELAAALVQAGASPGKRDRWGYTPEVDARNARPGHVVELLRGAAAPAATAAAHAGIGVSYDDVYGTADGLSESPAASESSVPAGRLNPLLRLLAQSASSEESSAVTAAATGSGPRRPHITHREGRRRRKCGLISGL